MHKQVELMSPAGSFDALKAAINAGANAVYLGGNRFGARHFAENFDNEELEKAVKFAHLRGAKIYVTVNTLVLDDEVNALMDYLCFLSNIYVDGIIVQDLGVAFSAKKLVPNLPLMASTQLTVTNSQGVRFAENIGFVRTVLARETTLEEIKKIVSEAKSEVEVFVHGALCMSYSGQCLMSSLIGGRSGNRGQCAQPCRLPYLLTDEKGDIILSEGSIGKYILSPKDLNTIDLLPELLDAGVDSLKIEGRMKRPEYVSTVTSIYRHAIDAFLNDDFHVSDNDKKDLKQIFNRDFTTAYLEKNTGKNILSDRRPNNRGLQIGRALSFDREKQQLKIKLEDSISIGDELEVWVSVGGRATTVVTEIFLGEEKVISAKKSDIVDVNFSSVVGKNDRVFKVFDSVLMEKARSFFAEKNNFLLPVSVKAKISLGNPMKITFTDDKGNIGSAETDFIVEKALKHPLSEDKVKKQLNRIGDTDFYITSCEIDLDEGVIVPVSEINEARRKAIMSLEEAKLSTFIGSRNKVSVKKPVTINFKKVTEPKNTELSVHVDTIGKLEKAIIGGADTIIFGGESYNHASFRKEDYEKAYKISKEQNKKIYFATPRIISEEETPLINKDIEIFSKLQPDGLIISNVGIWEKAKNTGIPLWIDYTLNTFNSFTIDFWREMGAEGVTLSQELNINQIKSIIEKATLPTECIVQGNTEMMITKYCAIGSLIGNIDKQVCNAPCLRKQYYFKDRKNISFPLVTDQYCRMHILNSKELSMLDNTKYFKDIGISRIRIDARFMNEKKVEKITFDYKKALTENFYFEKLEDVTRGHFFRGVN